MWGVFALSSPVSALWRLGYWASIHMYYTLLQEDSTTLVTATAVPVPVSDRRRITFLTRVAVST